MIKRISLHVSVAIISLIIFCFTGLKSQVVDASIAVSGNNYTITNGNDLFNLLANTSSYWNTNTPPANMNIKVANTITLPGSSPSLYGKLQNVTVDFQQHQFYVGSAFSSVVNIPSTSSAQLTISNVDNTSSGTSNTATNVPTPNGTSTGNYYYSTYYGMLFSADFNQSWLVKSCNAKVNYNNVVYDMPNSIDYSQPLTTYFVPINFTGTNRIVTAVSGQQVGEIPNISVTSGTTTLIGGNGSAKLFGGMIYPYYNQLNSQTFPIDVASGATLNLENTDTGVPMFAFTGTNNAVVINNKGTLNMTSTATTAASTLFGSGVNGVTLNASANSNTNIKTGTAAFNGTLMSTAKLIGDFANTSKTKIISTNSSPLNNSSSWANGSMLIINSGAKLLTYSGGTNSGGLTNSVNYSIPFIFEGGSTSQGYKNASVSDTTDNYLNLSPNDSSFNATGTTKNSNTLTSANDNGMLISSELMGIKLGNGAYNWNYQLDSLSSDSEFLSRTSGDTMNFKVIDTRAATPSFSIMSSYSGTQSAQPFTMWFRNGSTDTQLSSNAQRIFSGADMTNNHSIYNLSFDNNSGLLIKANNKAKAGVFNGIVDWTLSDSL